jgi:5-methylcytosine-specific restriction endonuclease McrA
MNYAELLQKDEWKIRCNEILQRDNFICQDCGKVGLHNNSYFEFSSLEDLEPFFSNFPMKELSYFCNTIDLRLRKKNSVEAKFGQVSLGNKSYMYSFSYPDDFFHIICFYSNKKLEYMQNIKFCHDNKIFKYKLHEFKIDISTFLLADSWNVNTLCFDYGFDKICIEGQVRSLRLLITYTLDNKIFEISIPNSLLFEKSLLFNNLTSLHVHHKYYIKDHMPWEYNNDALVTLCPECHQKRHLQNKVPLFSKDKQQTIIDNLVLCDRCNGTGYLPKYHYYFGGVCFKCNGEGVCGY